MLTQLTGKSHELRRKRQYFLDRRVVRIKSLLRNSFSVESVLGKIPNQPGEVIDRVYGQSHRFANIPDRSLVVLLGNRRHYGSPVTAVFPVNVLHDFFTPFVLKVNIDIRRFVAC